eukprot:10207566-Karenia_brevis.AAC.1
MSRATHMQSNAMVYSVAPLEVDPLVHQLVRKVTLMRRILVKWPKYVDLVKTIGRQYEKIGYVGLYDQDLDLGHLRPAPPPGGIDRHKWKHRIPPK